MKELTEAQENILKDLVYNRSMYIGRDRLYKYMRRNNIPDHPTKCQVEQWLSKQEWHQRFHPVLLAPGLDQDPPVGTSCNVPKEYENLQASTHHPLGICP